MGGRLDDLINDLGQQSKNPAAPQGARDFAASQAMAGQEAQAQGTASEWLSAPSDRSYVSNAQQWYTGANDGGTANGWSTSFVEDYNAGWDAALADGTAANYFDYGTGIVTWDHTTEGGNEYQFGDIVREGVKVSNIYDDYERDAANLMLLPWLGDGKDQSRLFEYGDPQESLRQVDEFIRGVQADNNANMDAALSAIKMQQETQERVESIDDALGGFGDDLLAAGGGATGGAATGAGVGAMLTAWTGPGAAIGATVGGTVGGVIGGIGGWLNKDELTEAAARGLEIVEMSREEFGDLRSIPTAVLEAAKLTQKFTSPLQNLAHGGQDAARGTVGDGVVERFTDDEADGKDNSARDDALDTLGAIASWTALAGDSVLQAISPLNRGIYAAQMSAMIGGESLQLATTGSVFDPREGRFDNIFIDDQGNADPTSALAGIAKIGIDAVQMTGRLGFARQSTLARESIEAGGSVRDIAGRRFILDEAGNVTSQRSTMAIFAPSEQLAWVSATRQARVRAMSEYRAGLRSSSVVQADDFYEAALKLSTGSSKLRQAIANGFGEGYEEAVQGILEPVSTDGQLSFSDIRNSFLYGAAGGAGFSLGGSYVAPTSDERLMSQAYALTTLRDEAEPEGFDEMWKTLSRSEKKLLATASPAEMELVKQAREAIERDHTASLPASEADVAKAIDARRAQLEKDLQGNSTRTDAYHVMSGQVDAGRVDARGTLLGDTAPADAIEASATTIAKMLGDRLQGLTLQVDTLPETEVERREFADLSARIGEQIAADVEQIAASITEALDAGDTNKARFVNQKLNQLLHGFYTQQLDLVVPEDLEITQEQARMAAAHFVTMLQSREPKLDAGSYLALLPRSKWELTESRSDNFVMVNVDILQAINGDFDGDKLHAENQISLTPERFVSARAGDNFGGALEGIDIATRNFEGSLTAALGSAYKSEDTGLRAEARATLRNIHTFVSSRYGNLMSPAALTGVLQEFDTAIKAGSPEARSTLLNALAREAGEKISNMGAANLRNEWLHISKVVRANLEAFQGEYYKLRQGEGTAPMLPVPELDTPEGKNYRKTQATTDAQTLSLFAAGNTLFRKFQKIHYTWFNSPVLESKKVERADLEEMARFYEELAKSITISELQRVGTDDTIAGRVLVMLERLVRSTFDDKELAGKLDPATAMTILANTKVKNVWFENGKPVTDKKSLSLTQVLLARALDADREAHATTFNTDTDLQAKHARLRQLTNPSEPGKPFASRAFLEVFKGIPFGQLMGTSTGNLAMHTTAEQWLRDYTSLDQNARADMARFYTQNVPEYLDRKQTTNLPYTLSEASTGSITAYRSMMDAMIDVGNHMLTFDPSKDGDEMFSGEFADMSIRARDDFKAGHTALRKAAQDYREILNRNESKRLTGAQLAQRMLNENPREAKAFLDLLPNSAANALYELKDDGLWVAPWIYEMLTIENPDEALFFYWKNLLLTQWNATQSTGRNYDKLESRMMRLLYELAEEPGEYHLQVLLQRLAETKDINTFYKWLNTTPGYRSNGQAAFVPFVDDVADFDAESIGGWVTLKPGSDLRTAIATMRTSAEALAERMSFRNVKDQTDRLILDGIKKARNDDPTATPTDRENLRKLTAAVSRSNELPRAFSPNAMLALLQGAMSGVMPGSHEKGKTAAAYGPLGQFQMLVDALGFKPGLERMMDFLTAQSITSLKGNLRDVSRTSGKAMDAYGRPVQWAPLDVDQAISLLDDATTAPLAHALLTPTALDLSMVGTLVERTLFDASLKDLLDESHYQQLFVDPEQMNPAEELDQATRYLSLVEAKARADGGHFDAMKMAGELAISRTSSLGRPATPGDLARLRDQAIIEVAKVLKMVAQIQTDKDSRDADLLKSLRKHATEELRKQRASRKLPAFASGSTGEVVEEYVQILLKEMELQKQADEAALLERYTGDELTRRSEMLDALYERNAERVKLLLDDQPTLTIMQKFHISGDEALDVAAKKALLEFGQSTSAFPRRAPEAAEAWAKLESRTYAGLEPDLTTEEWQAIARGAMGIALTDAELRVASHISVPPFPKGDPFESDARFFRFFDPTYSYLGMDLLDESNPLVQAAQWLHLAAGQPRSTIKLDDAERILDSTILDRSQLGTWTPGLMAQIVEMHERMDSAGGPAGIGAAGNGPKRQAALAAATQRTGEVPSPDLLTTAAFTGDMLAAPFSLIAVTPAGSAVPTSPPLAMLNNRFFGAVRLNGVDIPLDTDNLGFEWAGAEAENPYRYVALSRLQRVVERYAAANSIKPSEVSVEVDFFHPDSKPADQPHNAFFDGMAHATLPDGNESLLATLWADNDGQISKATQWTIDAGKKAKRAIQPFRVPDAEALAEVEENWTVRRDLAGLLHAKAEMVVRYDDGSGALGADGYNAVLKQMKLQHLVVGRDAEDKVVALTADQAIALQNANGLDTDFGLVDARLVELSPDVLLSMIGDTTGQGVDRFFDDDFIINPELIGQYQGITEQMLARFGAGWIAEPGGLKDTPLANLGAARVQRVSTMLSRAERNKRRDRAVVMDTKAAEVRAVRAQRLKGEKLKNDLIDILSFAQGSITTELLGYDFTTLNAGVIAPRDTHETDHSLRTLDAAKARVEAADYARGFRVRDGGAPDYVNGVLTVESLDAKREQEDRVVKGDWALLELEGFDQRTRRPEENERRVEQALRYLANTGAYIVLGPGNGRSDLRFYASRYLATLGYVPIEGSRHAYQPIETTRQTQNERAYESTLIETNTIIPARNAITFLSTEPLASGSDRVMNFDENMAVVNPRTTKLRDRKLISNLLRTIGIPGFNLPLEDNRDNGLYAKTLAHLSNQLRPGTETRAALLAMAGKDPRGAMPVEEALDRFLVKLGRSGLSPQPGDEIRKGDIIPFVHADGKVYLYRHGFKLPKDGEDLRKRLQLGGNVALAQSETESAATANDGVLREIKDRVGYGKQMLLEQELQLYGDKVQLDYNGMKYVLVPPVEGFDPPPVFANGTVIDLFSDRASSKSKEAELGIINNLRDALTFFQFDFTTDLTEFFFPGQGNDATSRVLTKTLLDRLASQTNLEIPLTSAAAISKANLQYGTLLGEFAQMQAAAGVDPSWVERLADDSTPSALIARAVITYLLTPHGEIDNVLQSSGFSDPRANSEIVTTRQVPGLFADLLDYGTKSPLHEELIKRFNAQLYRGPKGEGLRLNRNWTVDLYNADGTYTSGWLQFGPATSSGDNPVTDGQAYDPTEKQDISEHNAMAVSLAVGGITSLRPLEKSKKFADSFKKGSGVTKLGNEGETVWGMLTNLPEERDTRMSPLRRETPGETLRRAAARREIVGLYHELNTSDWDPADLLRYENERDKLIGAANLYGQQTAMIDSWVRMWLGRPYEIDQDGNERGIISAQNAIDAVVAMRSDMRAGFLPLQRGQIPLMDINHLTTLYQANVRRERGWAPKESSDKTAPRAASWDAWVEIALGSAFGVEGNESQRYFDEMYTLAVDGLMHGYQGATSTTRYLPVSSDLLITQRLMDPETNRMLVSISEDENLAATDPVLFNAARAELDQYVTGTRIYEVDRNGLDSGGPQTQQKKRIERWRVEGNVPRPVNERMRGVRAGGQSFIDYGTRTSAMFRIAMNARVGNTLLNPLLIVSAPIEAFINRSIRTLTNAAMGEGTGFVAQKQARLMDRIDGTKFGEVMGQLGITPRYTLEEMQELNQMTYALSTRTDFKSMVYKELMYQYPSIPGIGRVERAMEKYAKFGARLQDPAWGMLPKDLARIYLETVQQQMALGASNGTYTTERLLVEMRKDPQWVAKNDLEVHNKAIAAIANVRSVKPNVLSLAVRGAIEPLSENPSVAVNAAGNFLKLLTAFQNFWASFGVRVTGLQAPVEFMAFFLDGKHKKLTARAQAALRGEPYDASNEEFFDMSEVLESIDLTDAFIKGGVTHTGLFLLGTLAGGLGLSGEDEETKWRRKQAELQGVGMLFDPRKIQADFRNKDSIYLDWLPDFISSRFEVNPDDPTSRSMAQMNWVARTFLSPIIGMERFYNSGDITEVLHGFKDAIGSHPIVNQLLWNEATNTFADLTASAEEAAGKSDYEQSMGLMVAGVSVLESMLMENAALNMFYIGMDEFDRDPYKLPLRDSDGDLQRDMLQNARANNSALSSFINDEGQVQQGYLDRFDRAAQLRSFTENRLTLAALSTLGARLMGTEDPDFFRYQMPVKTREIDIDTATQEEAEAFIRAAVAYQIQRSQPNVTLEEILPEVRNDLYALGTRTGQFFENDQIYAAAEAVADQKGVLVEGLFDGQTPREVIKALDTEEARRIFKGLYQGTLKFGDEAMAGVSIPYEMREQIAAEWTKEFVQQGIDLGLDKIKAVSRMKRIMYGPLDEPEVPGVADILFSKDIASAEKQIYGQLNTTYVAGPDGRPWATGFKRDGFFSMLGLQWLKPVIPAATGMELDGRGNAVDLINGNNTGLRGLMPFNSTMNPMTDEEIGKMLAKAIEDAAQAEYTPTQNYDKVSGGSGYRNFGGYYGGYGGYGYSSGGGGGGRGYFSRMYSLPDKVAPYGNSMSFINTSNPILRRASVRRERVSSERGRLNQWQ